MGQGTRRILVSNLEIETVILRPDERQLWAFGGDWRTMGNMSFRWAMKR